MCFKTWSVWFLSLLNFSGYQRSQVGQWQMLYTHVIASPSTQPLMMEAWVSWRLRHCNWSAALAPVHICLQTRGIKNPLDYDIDQHNISNFDTINIVSLSVEQLENISSHNRSTSLWAKPICSWAYRWRGSCDGTTRTRREVGNVSTARKRCGT